MNVCKWLLVSKNGKPNEKFKKLIEEYKQYKALEKDLGVGLVPFIKALNEGIRILDNGRPYNDSIELVYDCNGVIVGFKGRVSEHVVYFKDYGKTWISKEDELEHDERKIIK